MLRWVLSAATGRQEYCEEREGNESKNEDNFAEVLAVPAFCCKEGASPGVWGVCLLTTL